MPDIWLKCMQCGQDFRLSGKEQNRLATQDFDMPKRCPECRKHKMKLGFEGDAEGAQNRAARDKESKHSRQRQDKLRIKEHLYEA